MIRPPQPHDTQFMLSLEDYDVARDYLFLCLPALFFKQIDWSCRPRIQDRTVPGWDGLRNELDGSMLVRLLDGRPLVQAIDHKSFPDRLAKSKLAVVALRHALWLGREGGELEGEVPVLQTAIITHGSGSGRRWQSYADLARLSEEERRLHLETEPVKVVDLGEIDLGREHLNPKTRAILLGFSLHLREPPPTDAELDVLATGYGIMGKDLGRVYIRYCADTLEVPADRWRKAMARVLGAARGKEIMGTLTEQLTAEGMAKGKAEGKAETFLLIARQKFRDIPSERQEQLLAASPRQLDEWTLRLLSAPDLDSVFNGDPGDRNDVGGERLDFGR